MEAMRERTPESQEMMMPTPRKEHEWLQRLVGEWTIEGEASMGPDQPMAGFSGTESVRSIGGIWIEAEARVESPDGAVGTNILTLGFDTWRARFVGSFISSMMTYMWSYDGELDPSGRALNLNTEGPTMAPEGNMARFREVIEFVSDDHRTWTSWTQADDGSWQQVMRSDYRRRK